VVGVLGAGGALALFGGTVRGQGKFPSRPVRIVVPYSVGIGPDVVARAVADWLAARWGQPVVVENKPGASGIVAFAEVRQVAADGHTLFLGDTGTLAVNPLIHRSLPYDPQRDLLPITLLFRATFLLLAGGGSRFKSVGELVAAARVEPGRVSYASLGNGHPSQVAVETLGQAGGVQFLHVPFKDAGTLFTSVANADVDFTAFGYNSAAGLLRAGKLRALAVAGPTRIGEARDIPTIVEAGGPAVQMRPWAALMAVANTPEPVYAVLRRDVVAALNAPEVRARIEAAGFEPAPTTPAELRALIAADAALYETLVRDGRLRRE
jgi:tripartite-type tricarboxylate transporter receptor subunit TctC